MQTKYLKINSEDNVAVALVALHVGESVTVGGKVIGVVQEIPAGHKFALKDFAEKEFIVKYGYAIGHAREAIAEGGLVNE